MIEFPIEELEKDGDGEVIEILKERRRTICEFLMKILNSFKIIDGYFIDGTIYNVRNVIKVLEESKEKSKIKLNYFEALQGQF
jgi:hypothetical protein